MGLVGALEWRSCTGVHGSGVQAALLERGGFDDAEEQAGEVAVFAFQPLDDLIHVRYVVIFQATPDGVGQEFLGEGAIELRAVVGGEDALQVADVLEGLA